MRHVTLRPEGVKDVLALEQLFEELKPRYIALAVCLALNPYRYQDDYETLEQLMKETIPRDISDIKGMIDLGDKFIFINIILDRMARAESMVVKYEKQF